MEHVSSRLFATWRLQQALIDAAAAVCLVFVLTPKEASVFTGNMSSQEKASVFSHQVFIKLMNVIMDSRRPT